MQDFSFGLISDIHYTDMPDAPEKRFFYLSGLGKARAAAEELARQGVPMLVLLGDLVEGYGRETPLAAERTRKDLRALEQSLEVFPGERFHLVGNHDLLDLTKREFLGYTAGRISATRYSFDRGPLHFVALDANFRADGADYARGDFAWRDCILPADQLAWLEADLKAASDRPAIILCHQCLDDETSDFGVKNAHEVREVLQRSGNVAAVLQGHRHAAGVTRVGGIAYITLAAMAQGGATESAFAVATWRSEAGRLDLRGYGGNQPDFEIVPE